MSLLLVDFIQKGGEVLGSQFPCCMSARELGFE